MRRNFSSSRLVRVLGRWEAVGGPQTLRQDVAERLGQWLGVRDAITLDAAHRAIQVLPGQWSAPRGRAAAAGAGAVAQTLDQEVQRVRATLVQAIMAAPVPAPVARRGRHALPPVEGGPAAATEPDADAAFAPLRKRCSDLERQMDLRVDALRAHVRKQVAACAPALAQLAALDAVMQQMLGERMHKALSALPALLEQRCMPASAGAAAPVKAWEQDMQDLLLAELETRLEPVVGLTEALRRHGAGTREVLQ